MKYKLLQAVCLVSATLSANVAVGEILAVPGGNYSVTQNIATPRRGANVADVLAKFGEPVHRHRAVGTPAISSWEYQGFAVYFEEGFVIHSVVDRS